VDTGQKTESILRLVEDIVKDNVALPEFQRDFVWDIEKTFDLFDSFARDIFVGSLIYGVPSSNSIGVHAPAKALEGVLS
jgi:uncharacterized protein with ParB-like and HNH nuclease domain